MGSLPRLHRFTLTGVEALVEGLESPEILLPQLLRGLQQQVHLARELKAKAAGARALEQQEARRMCSRMDRMSRAAATAVQADDEWTARKGRA